MKNTCAQLAVFGILFFWQSIVLAQGANESAQIARATEEIAANANWADMVFGDGVPPAQAADRVTLVHEDVAGDTKIGRCGFGTPLRLGEKTYTRGIGVNSRCVLRVSTAQAGGTVRGGHRPGPQRGQHGRIGDDARQCRRTGSVPDAGAPPGRQAAVDRRAARRRHEFRSGRE